AAQFWSMASLASDKQHELVKGELIEMPPPNRVNSILAAFLVYALRKHIEEAEIEGYVLGADGGYTLSEMDVRVPDVSFIFKSRLPNPADREAIIAPDIAVEVISPSETPRLVHEKTALYLQAGTSLVWNIYPEDKIVEVWTSGDSNTLRMQMLDSTHTLTGGIILPKFSVAIDLIFKQIIP
ncbi:MAG: Uma2 family endonuclease, partial [Anaerolineae bacterium]|nr:Uma2 family endonuclease [Anaerolineae bacterium]